MIHSTSQHSVAASDDYYSLSEASNQTNGSKVTVVRYQTPPTRNPSPSRNVGDNVQPSTDNQATPASQGTAVVRDQDLTPKGPSKMDSGSNPSDRMDTNRSTTETPSAILDDMPYIRFAIDQLTRDEELLGEGRQGSVASLEYPVDRIVPDEGLGYYNSTERRRPSQRTVERRVSEARTAPGTSSASIRRQKSAPHEELSTTPSKSDNLVPIDPPGSGYRYFKLDFVPYSLRPYSLGALIFLCLSMMAALIFCNVWPRRHEGLWDYDYFGGAKYFVMGFLPQLLGIFLTVWLFVVQSAVYRTIPFATLTSSNPSDHALQNLPILPCNFLLPDLSHFKYGEPLVGICLFIVWLVNLFAVPLHSCLFQAQFFGTVDEGAFKWTSSQGVGWTLVALYAILVLALFALVFRFSRKPSGLMWDPVSLGDLIPIIQRSNVLSYFDRTETSMRIKNDFTFNDLRLGYWTVNGKHIVYGIGEDKCSTSGEISSQFGPPERKSDSECSAPNFDAEEQMLGAKDSFERSLHSPFIRYRWAPWFLRDTFIVAWIAIALILLIAFIVVTFVDRAIENGFRPLLPTLPSATGFSPSNFLYSFIPALLGMVLFLIWQPIDLYFRSIQPFSNLSSLDGASADDSLLLGYPSCLPLEVTFRALAAGHYKVAYVSFIGAASLAIPVLSGGIFMAQTYYPGKEIRISSYTPAYYTLMAFLIVYAFSFLALWPRRKRYIPHPLYTYADIISFLYQSPLLEDTVFREPKTKADLVTRAIVAPPGENKTAAYGFGVYRGRDGRDHLGIDRLRRPGRVEMVVSPT